MLVAWGFLHEPLHHLYMDEMLTNSHNTFIQLYSITLNYIFFLVHIVPSYHIYLSIVLVAIVLIVLDMCLTKFALDGSCYIWEEIFVYEKVHKVK